LLHLTQEQDCNNILTNLSYATNLELFLRNPNEAKKKPNVFHRHVKSVANLRGGDTLSQGSQKQSIASYVNEAKESARNIDKYI
jgi:hypothetical protein